MYLSQLVGTPVFDANNEKIGTLQDVAIATREVFPRVMVLVLQASDENTPTKISWRRYVFSLSASEVKLNTARSDIRAAQEQPDEVLLAHDLLNKQIVDTSVMHVVRVSDIKLSDSPTGQLRLLGAEVGVRGMLRSVSPALERSMIRIAHMFGHEIPEKIVAWNYMDLINRNFSNVKLSVFHHTLDDLHPADVADIIERLDPHLRSQVFAQLDDAQAAEAMAELDDDELAAKIMGNMDDADASRMLSEMDPDDAAELVGELDYERAEKLLRRMGIKEQRAIRQLLGYRDNTAGRIMTSEFVAMPYEATVSDVAQRMRELPDDFEPVNYVYLTDEADKLAGVISVRRLFISDADTTLGQLLGDEEVLSAKPDDDQEDVAENIAKYNLLAMPVVDEKTSKILGIVTVDDALDVLEEEHEEDLQIAGGPVSSSRSDSHASELPRFLRHQMWFFFWVVAGIILSILLGPVLGLAVSFAAPVTLLISDEVVRYATNFFIEYDADDEDAPSLSRFTLTGLIEGALWVAIIMLVALIAQSMLSDVSPAMGQIGQQLLHGFEASSLAILVGFITAPVYLSVLRHRDARGEDTSGSLLNGAALTISLVVFVVSALLLCL